MPKVHFISLGCARNRVDTEVMMGSLVDRGYEVVQEADVADLVVVNTCGFIGPAKEESVNTILEVAAFKEQNPQMKLVVTGCLTQRYSDQLVKGLPEVDLFIGTDEFPRLSEFLEQNLSKGTVKTDRADYLYSGELPKLNTLSSGSAYVKVAEGCQHSCAFCVIPTIRGKLRSRPVAHIISEVKRLTQQGVVEINLIAQDLAAYGRDGDGNVNLLGLLKEIVQVEGVSWVRLLYVYPENIDEEFLEFFATEPKIVKYLDIPMQHASDSILKRMRRNVSRLELETILAQVRARVADVAIRTSVIVGFPGETEQDFADLKQFVRKQKFEHLGCFCFSREEGTAAYDMEDQIDEKIMEKRRDEIMKIQQKISQEHLKSMIGKTFSVLVKGLSDESDLLAEGRLSIQAPEVDGVVYINDGDFKVGTLQNVEITEAHAYDLVGHIV